MIRSGRWPGTALAAMVAFLLGSLGGMSAAGSEPQRDFVGPDGPNFYFWRYAEIARAGEQGERFVRQPNVHMLIVPRFRYNPNWGANPNPPGLEDKTYPDNLQGMAEWLADWQEWTGATRGNGTHGNGDYANAIYPMMDSEPDGWELEYIDADGRTQTVLYPGQHRPFHHPDDALTGAGEDDPGRGVWFNKHGIEELRRFWQIFLPILKEELDSRGLCYFAILANDMEDGNARPMHWWEAVREDERHAEQIILENEDGSRQWTSADLLEEYEAAGIEPPDPEAHFSNPRNDAFRYWWLSRRHELRSYLIHRAIHEPWRQVFPGTPWLGNYNDKLADNPDYPTVRANGTWIRNITILHMDYSSKSMYFSGPPHFHPENVREYHPELRSDYAVFRELQLRWVEAIQRSSRPTPIFPWIAMPHYRKTVVLPDDTQREDTALGISESEWLIRQLTARGVDTFLVWGPAIEPIDEGAYEDGDAGPGRTWPDLPAYLREYRQMIDRVVQQGQQE